MGGWFTVEKIDDRTFALSEYRHWEEPHCYLLLGTERALLIDTGLGAAALRPEVEALTSMPVMAALTHAHWDHMGGLGEFGHIAVHEAEKAWLEGEFPLTLAQVRENLTRFPCVFPADFRIEGYCLFQGAPREIFRDGDVLDLGGRTIRVIHTPGHSPGHCCFYEPERQYLYTGDLLYRGCLDAFYPTTDPALFWQSLERVRALPVRRIFPGHHDLDLPPDLRDRAAEAFAQLDREGRLKQGQGVLGFGDFSIHI